MSATQGKSSWEVYRALGEWFHKGDAEANLVSLLIRLMAEVEAMREALASPETPEAVRQSYRKAYERIAVLSHNAAGPGGGTEKILHRLFPDESGTDRFAPELAMLERLGATPEERQALRKKMEEVEMYT